MDVTEVRTHVLVRELVSSPRQGVDGLDQRRDCVVKLEDLALELVDALGGVASRLGEHLPLDLPDGAVDACDHGRIVVDDAIDDRVEHRSGAAGE